MDDALTNALNDLLAGRVCVLGIGNRLWRDDGVGSLVAEALQDRPELDAVDGGMVPENYLERVLGGRPETVLIVDAVDFDGRPGELRLLAPTQIAACVDSPHAAIWVGPSSRRSPGRPSKSTASTMSTVSGRPPSTRSR